MAAPDRPRVVLTDLVTRHTEFLNGVSRTLREYSNQRRPVAECQTRIAELQAEYAAWFADRGVTLVCEDT